MHPPEHARRWQERIDKTFPHGVLLTADDESNGRTESYLVPRPEVVALRGMDPVVFIEIPQHNRNFFGTILSWEPVQESPCTVVRVAVDRGHAEDGHDELERWSSNLSAGAAATMREWRTMSLEASERGGVYRGPQWFGEEQ